MVLDKSCVIKYLAIPLLFALSVNNLSFAQGTTANCVDADGDGWGWDGTGSCRIQPVTCVDTDGDGWGWDGSDTCRISEDLTPQPEFSTQFCTDTDGDGWGWNGTDSCLLDEIVDNTCIDSDGDGWGWNGESSCLIDTQSGCIDTDGDGWGWNGYQTCLVSADTINPESTNNCLINGASVNTALSQLQCDVLLEFYTSTNGDTWDNNDQWITATDPCTWHGIECKDDDVDVIAIRSNGMTGFLPASINQLQGLTVLVLDDNDLSGPVPDLSATKIGFFDLQKNRLNGSIPAGLGSLPLGHLNLGNNQLTGSIPASLGRLSTASILLLNDNQLTGTIPTELNSLLGNQRLLELLGLRNNLLSGSLDGISNIQNHRPGIVSLGGNQCFTAADPDFIIWLEMFARNWDDGCL